jgi:hypothetical protein
MPNEDLVWGGRRIGKLTKASLDRLASARFQDTSTSSPFLAGVEDGMVPLDPHPRRLGTITLNPTLRASTGKLGWAAEEDCYPTAMTSSKGGLGRFNSHARYQTRPAASSNDDGRWCNPRLADSDLSSRAGCCLVACKPPPKGPPTSVENLDSNWPALFRFGPP